MPPKSTAWPPLSDHQASTQAPWRSNGPPPPTEPHRQMQGSQALFDSSEPDVAHSRAPNRSGLAARETSMYSQHQPAADSPAAPGRRSQPANSAEHSSFVSPPALHPPTGPASQRSQVPSRFPWTAEGPSQRSTNTIGRNNGPIQSPSIPSQWSGRAQTQRQSRFNGPAPVLDQAMFRSPHTAAGRVESLAQQNKSDFPGASNATTPSMAQNSISDVFQRLTMSPSATNAHRPSDDHQNRSFQSRTLGRLASPTHGGYDGTSPSFENYFAANSSFFPSAMSTRGFLSNSNSSFMQQSSPANGSTAMSGMPSWNSFAQHPSGRPDNLYNDLSPPSYIQSYQYHNGPSDAGATFAPPMPPALDSMAAFPARQGFSDAQQPAAMRSALLQTFRDRGKQNPKWELKDIVGHIVEFSGDHNGSMFIQMKLKDAKSEEKDQVFREIRLEAVPLMKDVFGNYVMQKFFEHGDQEQKRLLVQKMRGRVAELAKDTYGCRVVQSALSQSLSEEQSMMILELQPVVMELVRNENGNHVIQAIIRTVRTHDLARITDQFFGHVRFLSTHRYGCRIVQRMLECCESVTVTRLMDELEGCIEELITDQYGNYVPQHIIQHGRPREQARIFGIVLSNLVTFSKQKYASNVVEKCVAFGTPAQKFEIARHLFHQDDMERGELLPLLIRDAYGNYVIQSLLDKFTKDVAAEFAEQLQPSYDKAVLPGPTKQTDNVGKKMERAAKRDGWNAVSGPSHRFGSSGAVSYRMGASIHAPTQINTQVQTMHPAGVPTPPLTVGGSESPQSSDCVLRRDSGGRATLTPESSDDKTYDFGGP